jgi:AcrR family transcriptional regulator
LITTAAELFRRQGYAQTGVNQIIQKAKATSGSFYHFFPAKEDLLLAVVDHIAEVFAAGIFDSAADRSNDPVEGIFNILDLYRRQLVDGGFTFGSPMASLSAEVSENHPEVRNRLAEVFADWTSRIEELLRDAGDRLPSTLDRNALAQLVVCTMEGAVLGARLNRSLTPFDSAVNQLRTYFDLLENQTEIMAAGRATQRTIPASRPHSVDWKSW